MVKIDLLNNIETEEPKKMHKFNAKLPLTHTSSCQTKDIVTYNGARFDIICFKVNIFIM